MTVKSVAVIGAGVSGLTAVKACLEQGLDVTCYEMHSDVGGLWYYTKQTRPDEGATSYDYMYANFSRETMRYSDFHFSDDAPVFPTRKGFHDYLRDYAEHFGIFKKVELNTKVLSIQESHNYAQPEGWTIEIQRPGAENTEMKEFGAVIIASGFHRKAVIPEIIGMDHFQGKLSHSKTFKTAKSFERKICLVIGNANSAVDVATGLSEYAEQVYLSVGEGCWVTPRNVQRMTWDEYLYRRYYSYLPSLLDKKWRNVCENFFNHGEFGMRPNKGPLHFFPTVNDEIAAKIANGRIRVVPKVVKFLYDGVQLEDGTHIRNIDHVVFATGFTPDHDLLEPILSAIDEEYLSKSYKGAFPVDIHKPTLAFVGMISSDGPFPPLAEMQARLVSLVFAGKHKLPSTSKMEADIKRWRDIRASHYGPNKNWTPSLLLTDEIAEEIGVYPSFSKLALKYPKLAFQTLFGPAYSAQYRLMGNGSTRTAVDDCMKARELTTQGIKLRQVPALIPESVLDKHHLVILGVFVALLILLSVVLML